jgi:Porin subfamily
MKMVKSLLLGSAAGLVAVSAGQAADLPVKAKPVEYVKVCSLYGAGFYYMPGTDICLKIGGYVRAETTWGGNGNFTQGPVQGDVNLRTTSNMAMRARAYITADAREQTAFGTARAYVAVGLASTDIGNTLLPSFLGFNRAFIQWAGMTAGITQSFYDFYSSAAVSYRGFVTASDTGDPGWWVWGYTAQLGNGISATIAAEQRRATQICDFSTLAAPNTGLSGAGACQTNGDLSPAQGTGSATGNSAPFGYGGLQAPDIVGNIRIDQTWGSAQVMAAAHEVNAPYYDSTGVSGGIDFGAPLSGHPGDEWGWVVGAGLRLNTPFIAQGDYFQSQVNYTQGALRYVDFTGNAPTLINGSGNNLAYGLISDCVYGWNGTKTLGVANGTTGCNLTTAWGVNASYEHYWTPQFHESFVGSYMAVRYNDQANDILCTAEGFPAVGGGFGSAAVAAAGCNNNWQIITAATRFQYDVSKSLYLGVEFMYQRYQTMTTPTGLAGGLSTFIPESNNGFSQLAQIKDQQNLAVTARIHKDFLP